MTRYLLILFGGLSALATAPAAAQCRLCGTPATQQQSGSAVAPVQIEVETSLDFDRLILLGPSGGTASLRPDGSRVASGSLQGPGGRAMVGTVTIRGEPGRTILVDLPSRIALFGGNGARIEIERVVTDLAPDARLDSGGRLQFRFGGELQVSGDAEGEFRGDIPITVQYL